MGEFSHDFGAHIIPAWLGDRDLKIYLVRVSGRCSEGEGQKSLNLKEPKQLDRGRNGLFHESFQYAMTNP